MAKIEYEIVGVEQRPDDLPYQVEGIDYDNDGVIYVAVFSGPAARARAEEYAEFKNAQPVPA